MKNTKLIFHRCGLFFMFLTLFLLFVRDGENTAEMYTYTFRHAATILIWGLFFGASFVIFDIKKIPSLVSRLILFVLNGVATGVWLLQFKQELNLIYCKLYFLHYLHILLFIGYYTL